MILASFFEDQNRWARSRKPARTPQDISSESFNKASAALAAFKRNAANRQRRPKPETGMPLNPAFNYARFGGPYLKRS